MINFNPIRTMGAFAILGLAACSTSYQASNMGGEVDNLYFMASDARIATEYAVSNNNPENFKEIEQIRDIDGDVENFSAKNVNPEYIAKYQSSAAPAAEEATVYFDDSQTGTELGTGDPNINAYDNYTGANGSGSVTNNNFFMSPMMGFGMSPMMGSMYNPYFGSGFGSMGFYDPFYSGFGFNPGFGFRPGFNLSLGMGFGFGNPYFRRGFGMYDPFMNYGYGYRPGFGGLYGGGFGYYPTTVIVMPGGNEANRRQVVQGARPYRSSSLANANTSSRSRSIASPTSSRASARRDALSNNSSAVSRNRSSSTNNSFSRSQNDFYNSASAAPSRRNINSPVMNRSGNTSTRSSYGTTNSSRTYRSSAPSNSNSRSRNYNSSSNSRSQYSAPSSNSRSSSPSYNRSRSTRTTTPSYQRSTTPSRSSTYSAPSRSSSSYSAPRSSGSSSRSTGGSSSGSRRGN